MFNFQQFKVDSNLNNDAIATTANDHLFATAKFHCGAT